MKTSSMYATHTRRGYKPLNAQERIEQGRPDQRRVYSLSEEAGYPHISRYDIREFVY
jgi:hypothetical protein